MIERKDILSIPYLKKSAFTGSYEGLRFRFAAVKRKTEIKAWEAPYSYDATPEEKMKSMDMEFSEKGIQQGIDWLNGLWEAEPERWRAAKTNFTTF